MAGEDKAEITQLSYAPNETPPVRGRVVLAIVSALGLPLLWALFELQRAPYNPPADMSTLLTSDGILVVRIIMAIVAVVWAACLFHLVRRLRLSGSRHTTTGEIVWPTGWRAFDAPEREAEFLRELERETGAANPEHPL